MHIDIHIIINVNNNFGVGDHFQVLRVSEGIRTYLLYGTAYNYIQLYVKPNNQHFALFGREVGAGARVMEALFKLWARGRPPWGRLETPGPYMEGVNCVGM